MNNNYEQNNQNLNEIFLDNYFDSYKNLKFRNKNKILFLLPSFYKKWYYSSFIEETIITPCTIFDKLCKEHGKLEITFPAIRYSKIDSKSAYSFVDISYSVDNHPIVDDIKKFLDFCIPYLDVTDKNTLIGSNISGLVQSLSIQDNFYANYLLDLCLDLKLVKRMSAIYSNKAQLTANVAAFLKKSKPKILDLIVNSTLNILADQMKHSLPQYINGFTKSYFLDYLKNPKPIDLFFQQIYLALGINLDDFITDMDDFEELAHLDFYDGLSEALISSAYLFGIIIDKYFLTPFGYYLKLIMPIYYIPFNFSDEQTYLYDGIKANADIDTVIWSPCSNFFLTKLGLAYFNISANDDNTVALPDKIITDSLVKNIKDKIIDKNYYQIAKINAQSEKNVYELKIRLVNDKKMWFSMEIEEDDSLTSIHEEICDSFLLDYENDYYFNIGEVESPFFRYVAPTSKSKMKKADSVTILDLELGKNNHLTYAISGKPIMLFNFSNKNNNVKVTIDVVKTKKSDPKSFYPHITRRGKALADWENSLNPEDFF